MDNDENNNQFGGINTLDPDVETTTAENSLNPVETPEMRAKAQLERLLWMNESHNSDGSGIPGEGATAARSEDAPSESRSSRRNRRRKSSTRSTLEWIGVIVAALTVAMLIKTILMKQKEQRLY